MVQWLGPHAFTAGGVSLIPGRGTKILHAMQQQGQKKKKKEKKERQVHRLTVRRCWRFDKKGEMKIQSWQNELTKRREENFGE